MVTRDGSGICTISRRRTCPSAPACTPMKRAPLPKAIRPAPWRPPTNSSITSKPSRAPRWSRAADAGAAPGPYPPRALSTFGPFLSDAADRVERALSVQAQQFRGIAAEDCDLVVVTEAGRVEDQLDGRFCPWIGKVGSHHELACADLRHQVANALGTEHHGVVVKTFKVLGG